MEWQPIETAPKDGTDIIVFTPKKFGWPAEVEISYADLADIKKGKSGFYDATHWMPLPPPPGE